MENFVIYNPTMLHFGKEVTAALGSTAEKYGKKALLVYGKGSVKQNGIYDQVVTQLNSAGMEITEFSGIKPNPLAEDVDRAAVLARENGVEVIVAVGGGSVMDSAKFIAITVPAGVPVWDFYERKARPASALPLFLVPTLAATGSEMNMFAVIQNHQAGMKEGYGHPLMYPKHAFLDPAFTMTVPRNHTAYGIVDLIAHVLESYFGYGEATLPDRFVFAIVSEAIQYGPLLLNDLHNYELRAKIMYAATMALNGTTFHGRTSGDWGVHSIGHTLSLLFDLPHGASLSIVYPAWLRLHKEAAATRMQTLFSDLFGTTREEEGIRRLEAFFQSIGCPVRLSDAGIGQNRYQDIFDNLMLNKVSGANHKFDTRKYYRILELMA